MTLDNTQTSQLGKPITMGEDDVMQVPNVPILALIEEEGCDADLWPVIQGVLDCVVAHAYMGERKLIWQSTNSDEASLMGIRLKSHADVLSLLFSTELLLRQLTWNEAADILQKTMSQTLKQGVVPDDCVLMGGHRVSISSFCQTIIEQVADEPVFDVNAAQYDELADRFHEEFEAGAEKTTEFAQKAMDKAREQLTLAGKFTEEQGHKLKEFLENDFSRVAQEMKKGAQEKLNPSRLGVGALASMSKLLHKTGVALSSFGDKAEDALTCKSGEITSAGKLVCKACGYEMNFKKTGRIPPCPKCHKTEFTKGY